MPEAIAKIIALGKIPMTPQMIADLALKADQDRRAAQRAGDYDRAQELLEERDALLDLVRNQS